MRPALVSGPRPMTDLAEALCESRIGVCAEHDEDATRIRAALREHGVHLVTVESLARAAQNHETSGIHGSLHCSLACGASLFAALEDEA